METKNDLTKTEVQNNGTVIKTTVSKILLEILVYGVEDDKEKIKLMLDKIAKQLDTKKAKNRARVLWYIDKGEKNTDEKKQWLTDNANCKYYVYAHKENEYNVSDTFVNDVLNKIKNFEKTYSDLKDSGINFQKK
jgi:secreted Zn-dependent insulinase-like peptidase